MYLHVAVRTAVSCNIDDKIVLSDIQCAPREKISILGGQIVAHSKQKKCICSVCVLFRAVFETEPLHWTVVQMHVKTHSDEQHAISSHEFQSALMLTVVFSKMCYIR
jgi:hypothetical protein